LTGELIDTAGWEARPAASTELVQLR